MLRSIIGIADRRRSISVRALEIKNTTKPFKNLIEILSRVWSGTQGQATKYSEKQLAETLKSRFPNAKKVQVTDVSGGCGAMFEILVESKDFKGMSIVKQHRMITDSLKNEIKDMHGVRIHTAVPQDNKLN